MGTGGLCEAEQNMAATGKETYGWRCVRVTTKPIRVRDFYHNKERFGVSIILSAVQQ